MVEKGTGTKTEPPKEQVHICNMCNNEIIGSYEYIKTKRGTELYICFGCAHPRKRQFGGQKDD